MDENKTIASSLEWSKLQNEYINLLNAECDDLRTIVQTLANWHIDLHKKIAERGYFEVYLTDFVGEETIENLCEQAHNLLKRGSKSNDI